ncbi:tetratricopeptide repeat protein [Halodesulfovibrio spirochaetisodalis]|uniref:Uncharacterized protein n=1 Tax=Halodesulfovibrio spirochaetisodalis TaxID=1560234 RepID=A0A1B7XCW1_9BACT|nr:tetratricopeptide repeat protein [Halodesulfovibrio spirochaetisodalis]OBQ51844.1 hypothetical protein SP90_08375 [Halodesulfovibrio spirochaetisodalis]
MSDYQTLKVLGEYNLALGDTAEATECFKAAIEANSESCEPIIGLAAVSVFEGDYDSALALYMKAAAVEKSAKAHAGIGLVLAEQGKNDESFKQFLIALSIDPINKVALNGLLQLGYSTERVDELLPVFSRALEEDNTDTAVRFSYATCLFSTDRKDESIEEFKEILRLDPEHEAAKEVLAHIAA